MQSARIQSVRQWLQFRHYHAPHLRHDHWFIQQRTQCKPDGTRAMEMSCSHISSWIENRTRDGTRRIVFVDGFGYVHVTEKHVHGIVTAHVERE